MRYDYYAGEGFGIHARLGTVNTQQWHIAMNIEMTLLRVTMRTFWLKILITIKWEPSTRFVSTWRCKINSNDYINTLSLMKMIPKNQRLGTAKTQQCNCTILISIQWSIAMNINVTLLLLMRTVRQNITRNINMRRYFAKTGLISFWKGLKTAL